MAGMNISPDVWAAKYGGGQQAYAGAPVQSLIQGLATPEETQVAYDANGNGASGGGQRAFYRANGFDIVPLPNGQYAVYRAGSPEAGAEALNGTPYDIYDGSGKFVGSRTWSGLGDKIGDLWEKAVPLATTAMIGGGIAGGFGYGPFAGGGAAPGAAGFAGDPTAWGYAGVDAAGAGTLGGGYMGGAGALGAGGAGTAAMGAAGGGGGAVGAGGAGAAAAGGEAGVPANPFFGGGAASGSSLFGGSGGFDWSSLVGPAISAASGIYGANQAGKAADAQLQATREAAALMEPFRQGGIRANNRLQELLGIGGDSTVADYGSAARDFSMADFQKDPGYQFRMDEGQKALERSAAARGGLMSGKAVKDTMRFSQGLASDEYGRAYDRYGTNIARKLNPLQAMSGQGQSAANTVGGYTLDGGNARAAGIVGRANALTNAVGQGYGMYQQNELMNRLMPQGRSFYGN